MVSNSAVPHRPLRVADLLPAPLPHEHGAWIMLLAPILLAAGTLHPSAFGAELLLALTAVALFLARNAGAMALRPRDRLRGTFWTAVYLTAAALVGAPLCQPANRELLKVAALALLLLAIHSALLLAPDRRRWDRSQWGELVGAAALTLTAPAACVVAGQPLDGLAWCLWIASALFFGSGVCTVKMALAAAKERRELSAADRWRISRVTLVYHALLLAAIAAAGAHLGPIHGALAIAAYAPALVRTAISVRRLGPRLPNLRAAGIREALYTVWFVALFLAALRIGS